MSENNEIFNYMLQLHLLKQSISIQFVYKTSDYSLIYSHKYHNKLELYNDLIKKYEYNSEELNVYNTIQKKYLILCRFVFSYLKRKRSIINNLDLYMNPIDPNDKYTIKLYHKGNNYLFTLNNMITLIKGKLLTFEKGSITSQRCKNPYNNLPFTKSCLLYFYFKYLDIYKYIEDVFITYYKHEFNERNFYLYNEHKIRHWYINNILCTNQESQKKLLKDYVDIIFRTYCKNTRIYINKDFPLNELLKIMKPYLYCFLIIKYCRNTDLSLFADKYLTEAIPDFAKFNELFGRKYINIIKNNKNKIIDKKITFNIKHPECSINKLISSNFIYKKTYDVTVSNISSILDINIYNVSNNSSNTNSNDGDYEDEEDEYYDTEYIYNYYDEEIDDTYDP